jgi:hypothetical protein
MKGDRCGRAPVWRGRRIIAVGEAFLNELGRAGIIRECDTSVRFPYRQSSAEPNLYGPSRRSDHPALLQSACCSCVRLRARHPFVPAQSTSAAARNNGRGRTGTFLRALLQKPRARHMLRRRRDASSVTGDRALQDNPTLQGRPIMLPVGGLSCSWELPDTMFGDAVDAMIVKGGAPSFLMPRKDDFDLAVIASDMLRPDRDRAHSAPTMVRTIASAASRAHYLLRVRRRSRALGRLAKSRSVCKSSASAWSYACFFQNAHLTRRRSVFGEIVGAEAAMSCLGMMRRTLNVFVCSRVRSGRGGALDRVRAR